MVNCGHYGFNNIKCKKSSHIRINNKPLCLNHAKLIYNKPVIAIQSHYRGYKSRRLLNNIYYNLPNELQHIIISYMNESHYNKKYIKTISNIITKNNHDFHNYNFSENKLSFDYLYNVYKLNYKYYSIISINYLKQSFLLGQQILNLCGALLEQDQIIMTNDSFDIFNKIQLINLDQQTIMDLMDMIYKFSSIYKYINHNNGSPLI
jgi:hypothetical protein